MELFFLCIFPALIAPVAAVWDFFAIVFDPKKKWGLSVSKISIFMGPFYLILIAGIILFTAFASRESGVALVLAIVFVLTAFIHGIGMASGAIE